MENNVGEKWTKELTEQLERGCEISVITTKDGDMKIKVEGEGLAITYMLSNLFGHLDEIGYTIDMIDTALSFVKFEKELKKENTGE